MISFCKKSAPIGFIYRSQLHIICGAAKEQLFQLCQHANSISTSTVRGPGILRLPLFCRASLARRCNRFFFAPRAHETRGILVRLLRLHQRCFSSNRTRRTVTAPSQGGTWTSVEERRLVRFRILCCSLGPHRSILFCHNLYCCCCRRRCWLSLLFYLLFSRRINAASTFTTIIQHTL